MAALVLGGRFRIVNSFFSFLFLFSSSPFGIQSTSTHTHTGIEEEKPNNIQILFDLDNNNDQKKAFRGGRRGERGIYLMEMNSHTYIDIYERGNALCTCCWRECVYIGAPCFDFD